MKVRMAAGSRLLSRWRRWTRISGAPARALARRRARSGASCDTSLIWLGSTRGKHKKSRFALVLHESNRGGLFNALNRIWWEKRRNYPSKAGVPKGEQLPPNLALIFTENP